MADKKPKSKKMDTAEVEAEETVSETKATAEEKAESETKIETETEKKVKTETKEKTAADSDGSTDEIERLKDELKKQKDLLLRTAAEFDNYKRRTERDRITAAEYTKAGMLKKLLPVFDNIDRANAADKQSADYVKGIEMTVKLLTEAVSGLGLIEIGAEGEAFDPNYHEAVMHIEDESLGENVVCKVLQKGYKIGDMVIRPAMVQVAN